MYIIHNNKEILYASSSKVSDMDIEVDNSYFKDYFQDCWEVQEGTLVLKENADALQQDYLDMLSTRARIKEELRLSKELEALKASKVQVIKDTCKALDSVTINDITYNGGDSSASAINGAIQLAQALGETSVKLWDVGNVIREYSFEEAMNISAQIAKAYRDAMFKRQELITAINNCETLEELEAIEL